jgi:hypothetical protein
MIPVTYPSSVSTSKESQMVVFALPSVTGLQRWTDYIPVKLQATGADIANSFNTNGYLACDFLVTTTGKQAWIDYIPVFVDNAATTAWQVSDTGFIPFNTLAGGGLYYLGPSLDLNFVGSLSNPLFASTAEDYTLNTNFLSLFYQVEAQYSVQGPTGIEQKNFADIVTFTRGSNATQFDSTGTLVYAPMNAIRNNMMVGAVPPSTFPTNWQSVLVAGLTSTVVGTGTLNGITYLDVRVNGTPSVSSYYNLVPDILVAGLSGQAWTGSFWAAIVGGSLANTNANIELRESDAVQGFLTNSLTNIAITSSLTRYSQVRTLNNAATAFVSVRFVWQVTSGQPVDFTLRIGMPQLELGSVATAVNATSGTAYYGPRFDYNPSTLAAQGLLIEESRTNSIRNNTAQGAVAGTPGTLPTNWTILGIGLGTLTQQVVGTGTTNGVNYIDYRVSGTTSTTGFTLSFEQAAQIVAVNGQTWASSAWASLIGGSTTNINALNLTIDGRTAAGAFVGAVNNLSLLGVTSTLTRYTSTGTIANASVERVVLGIAFGFASGVTIDITLRIGLPQLEQGAFATSVIPTTTTALTRSADVASVNTLSPWYNATEGTAYAEVALIGLSATANQNALQFSDGTSSNRIALYRQSSALSTALSFGATINGSSWTTTAIRKIALGNKSGDSALADSGAIAGTGVGTTVQNVNQLRLGSNHDGTGGFFNGYLRRITYYPRRLSNADLQTITT